MASGNVSRELYGIGEVGYSGGWDIFVAVIGFVAIIGKSLGNPLTFLFLFS